MHFLKAAGFLVFFAANLTEFIRNSPLFRINSVKFSLKNPEKSARFKKCIQPRGRARILYAIVYACLALKIIAVCNLKVVMPSGLSAQYFPILVFLAIAVGIACVMVVLPLMLGRKPDAEKVSPYECGFDPFGDARGKFDVRFYLVAILFIIFDLEIAFLFPWAVALKTIGPLGFFSMMFFLGVLTVGFVYEWKKGALEWE